MWREQVFKKAQPIWQSLAKSIEGDILEWHDRFQDRGELSGESDLERIGGDILIGIEAEFGIRVHRF